MKTGECKELKPGSFIDTTTLNTEQKFVKQCKRKTEKFCHVEINDKWWSGGNEYMCVWLNLRQRHSTQLLLTFCAMEKYLTKLWLTAILCNHYQPLQIHFRRGTSFASTLHEGCTVVNCARSFIDINTIHAMKSIIQKPPSYFFVFAVLLSSSPLQPHPHSFNENSKVSTSSRASVWIFMTLVLDSLKMDENEEQEHFTRKLVGNFYNKINF